MGYSTCKFPTEEAVIPYLRSPSLSAKGKSSIAISAKCRHRRRLLPFEDLVPNDSDQRILAPRYDRNSSSRT
ncbi:unnamed protein product [Cuscuta campestris]|uniref:Uncharacterized protein n=1 Tax=Cuscuta campestris TaxID=132261 RepID=A0A484KEP9_9ASTE|nr:unnamed protein product [Cuscuta campestris]